MKDYTKRFLVALAMCSALLVAPFAAGALIMWIFNHAGIVGVFVLIAIVSAALTAAMTADGPPPR